MTPRHREQADGGGPQPAWRLNGMVVAQIVVKEADDAQVGAQPSTTPQRVPEFLAGVVAGPGGVPSLPVDAGPPGLEALLGQVRIRVLVHGSVSKRDGVSEDEDAKRVRLLRDVVLARVAQFEAVDVHRHAREPPVVSGGQPLTADRIREKEARLASSYVP